MNHLSTRLGVVLSLLMIACVGSVTSLGGPAETKAPLAGEDIPEAGTDAPAPASVESDAGDAGSCLWYSWMPVATAVDNEYVLPSNDATNPGYPLFVRANWDLDWVRVERVADKTIGPYKLGLEACAGDEGWYFADGADVATATRYSLCPKTRDAVFGAADFRLSARVCR